jgi:hypothetical protein
MMDDVPEGYEPWSFDWHDENKKDSFLSWLIPTLIAYGFEGESAHDLGERLDEATDHFKDVRITVQINDVEVDPAHFIEGVEHNMRWSAQRRAQEEVQDKMNDLFDPISELVEEFRRKLKREVATRTGFELSEDDYY